MFAWARAGLEAAAEMEEKAAVSLAAAAGEAEVVEDYSAGVVTRMAEGVAYSVVEEEVLDQEAVCSEEAEMVATEGEVGGSVVAADFSRHQITLSQ